MAQVILSDVWAALDVCMPGYGKMAKVHHWWLFHPEGRIATYTSFPLGAHGSRKRVEIEMGHVRRMSRHFDILDCMKQQIPGL